MKLFEVCESLTGYIVGFQVYTGKADKMLESNVLDKDCTATTKLVFNLLEELDLLDKGYHLFMDNYYSSPELFSEMFFRQVYCCGTLRSNRKNVPKAVKDAKLKRGEAMFRRNGSSLVVKWCDKRAVTMITTIHEATHILTKKKDRHGNRILKPECIVEYTKYMSGVDLSDQYLTNYSPSRKSGCQEVSRCCTRGESD